MYPFKISPKPYYKYFQITSLPKEGTFYICRRSNSTEEPFDKFGLLKADSFIASKKDLPGLSMNILGYFKEKYVKYRSIKYASDEWRENKWVNYYKIYKYVEVIKGANPISLKLNSLHNQIFPYSRDDKNYKRKIPENLKNTHTPQIKLVVEHKPNNSNFWHVQLGIKDTLQEDIKVNIAAKYGDNVYNNFILHILSTARKHSNINPAQVPCRLYCKIAIK
jgi:hypothetical protein